MQATDYLPNGMIARDGCVGWELNDGRGYLSKDECRSTLDEDNLPFGTFFKIDWKIYKFCDLVQGPTFVEEKDE